jgi:hypothetical protein
MKMQIISSIIFCLSFIACDTFSGKDQVKDFIPGVYSIHLEGEYSKGEDTLIINRSSDEGNTYLITRNSYYQRILEGKLQPWEHKTEHWTALYNEKDKVLLEQRKGKVISFSPERNVLLLGSSEYKKIK